MKSFVAGTVPIFCILLFSGIAAGCANPVLPSAYTLEFPELPACWEELLGTPSWRVEWRTGKGRHRIVHEGSRECAISLDAEWPNPVRAWPFWRGVDPETVKPAGALYPFDAEGERLRLSWRGGVDAELYHALEEAFSPAHPTRRPEYFDWPRFRSVMAEIQENIRADPWLVNWKETAAKTISSSFRASYVKADMGSPVTLTIPHNGPWLSASPFRDAESWNEGDDAAFTPNALTEVWLCPGGIFKVSKTAQVWNARELTPP